MSAEMDNLNADIDRLIEEANAERDTDTGDTDGDNNDDTNNDSTGDDDNNDSSTNDDSNQEGQDESEDSDGQDSDSDGSEQEESTTNEETSFEKIKTKVSGQEITLESKEEVESFIANQNRNINTTRTSDVDEMVKQAKLSNDDLKLLADVKAGKPGALKKLADSNNIDLADADEFDGDYTPEFEMVKVSEVDNIIADINADTEFAPKFNEVVSTLPDDFLDAIGSNAHDLRQFESHVRSGLAAELLPQAVKMTSLGEGSLLENYIKVGEAKFAKKESTPAAEKPEPKQERQVSKKEQELRNRAGADSEKNKGGKSSDLSVEDLWDEDNLLEKVRNGEIDLRNLD